MRILIAEDESVSRSILSAMLGKCGYEVVETEDGESALERLLAEDGPKLAIIDWLMPGMDGLEVIRRIRAVRDNNRPYMLMLTSMDEKANIIAGLDAGADDYLTKPFDSGELKSRIAVGQRLIEMQDRLDAKIEELRAALDHVETLQGILPICCFCKKIRDDKGYWNQVEAYMASHSDLKFSHGICPDCMKKNYPELYADIEDADSE
ncbi:response regulator [Desulfoplanes sp.]